TVTTITITVTDQSMADQVADTIHQSMVTEFRSIAQLHTTAVPASESRPQDSVSTFGNRGQDVHMIHYPKKQAEELMVLRLLSFLFFSITASGGTIAEAPPLNRNTRD